MQRSWGERKQQERSEARAIKKGKKYTRKETENKDVRGKETGVKRCQGKEE
jgi:hypothetical protein